MLQKVTWLQENALNSETESDSRKSASEKKKDISDVRGNEKVIIIKSRWNPHLKMSIENVALFVKE